MRWIWSDLISGCEGGDQQPVARAETEKSVTLSIGTHVAAPLNQVENQLDHDVVFVAQDLYDFARYPSA